MQSGQQHGNGYYDSSGFNCTGRIRETQKALINPYMHTCPCWLLEYARTLEFRPILSVLGFRPNICEVFPPLCVFYMSTQPCQFFVIWIAALLNLGFSASSAQHLAPSIIAPTEVLFRFFFLILECLLRSNLSKRSKKH